MPSNSFAVGIVDCCGRAGAALLTLVCNVLIFVNVAYADVYLDDLNGLLPDGDNPATIYDNGDVLAVPGGNRRTCLNGSCFIASRLIVSESGSRSFERQWRALREENVDENRSFGNVFDFITAADDNLAGQIAGYPGSAEQQKMFKSVLEKQLRQVTSGWEKPIAFQSDGWKIIANLPVASYAGGSSLADTPVEQGYIMMQDAHSRSGAQGYWLLKFEQSFDLLSMIGDHDGDAPGQDPTLPLRPAGAKRTLHFSEAANKWRSSTWVYEGGGSMQSHQSFYSRQSRELGFLQSSPVINGENQTLLQFRDQAGQQLAIYLRHEAGAANSVQVVLQIRENS